MPSEEKVASLKLELAECSELVRSTGANKDLLEPTARRILKLLSELSLCLQEHETDNNDLRLFIMACLSSDGIMHQGRKMRVTAQKFIHDAATLMKKCRLNEIERELLYIAQQAFLILMELYQNARYLQGVVANMCKDRLRETYNHTVMDILLWVAQENAMSLGIRRGEIRNSWIGIVIVSVTQRISREPDNSKYGIATNPSQLAFTAAMQKQNRMGTESDHSFAIVVNSTLSKLGVMCRVLLYNKYYEGIPMKEMVPLLNERFNPDKPVSEQQWGNRLRKCLQEYRLRVPPELFGRALE